MASAPNNNDDDDDYMSDAILAQCADVRTSLLTSKATRERKIEEKQQKSQALNVFKPKKVIENENRSKALNTAISVENKGFTLMQKMGYKPGTAIGKSGQGLLEPIPVEIKDNRSGLGHEAHMKQKRVMHSQLIESMKAKKRKEDEVKQEDFIMRQRERAAERQLLADLAESQAVCEQLDREMNYKEPTEVYYWASLTNKESEEDDIECQDAEDDDDDDDDDDDKASTKSELKTSEMLANITNYLRSTHMYCIWCGTKYEDQADLQDNCPGNTSADHQ